MIDVRDLGLVPNGPDCAPAWNAAIPGLGNERHVHFPCGVWHVRTRLNPLPFPMRISGDGTNVTTIVRDYCPAAPVAPATLNVTDALFRANNTLTMEHLAIHAGPDTLHGTAIYIAGTDASDSYLNRLYITHAGVGEDQEAGQWDCAVVLDGGTGNKNDANGNPFGLRGCFLGHVETFACLSHNIWAISVHKLDMIDVGNYSAGGAAPANITIQGSTTGGNSYNITLISGYLEQINLYRTHNLKMVCCGAPTVAKDAVSTNIKVL